MACFYRVAQRHVIGSFIKKIGRQGIRPCPPPERIRHAISNSLRSIRTALE